MSQHDEVNIAAIYNGEPAGTPEQEAAKLAMQRERRANLPKLELAEGERLYIPREKLIETHRAYYSIFDEQQKGTLNASEEVKSYMDSVIFEAYRSEIAKLQSDYSDEGMREDYVHKIKTQMTTPDYERRGLLRRKKPNYAWILCQKQAELERDIEHAKIRDKIDNQERFLYGAFEAVFDELEEAAYMSVHRKRRGELETILDAIRGAHAQCNFEMLEKLIDELGYLISESVRWKKRRMEVWKLIGKLTECCEREVKREIEKRKVRISDKMVLCLIAEILKRKHGVPELSAPQPEATEKPVPEDFPAPDICDSQSNEEYIVSPDEADELESDMFDEIYGAELDELYELEDEASDEDMQSSEDMEK